MSYFGGLGTFLVALADDCYLTAALRLALTADLTSLPFLTLLLLLLVMAVVLVESPTV